MDKTVTLVMYHNEQRIEIGTATVDMEALKTKGNVDPDGKANLKEIVASHFTFEVGGKS